MSISRRYKIRITPRKKCFFFFTLTTQWNPKMNSQKEREGESEFMQKKSKMQNVFFNLCVSYDLGQEKELQQC